MSLYRQVLLDSPDGYWPLDESSGTTTKDRSGNGRDGTINGGVTFSTDPIFGRCYLLTGAPAGGAVGFGNLAAWDALVMTMDFWVKPSASAQAPGVPVSKQYGSGAFGTGEWTCNLGINGSGALTAAEWYWFQTDPNLLWRYVSPATVTDPGIGGWHHIAVQVDASNNIISWLNGVEVGRNDVAPTGTRATSSSEPMHIGSYGQGTFDYLGYMAHLAHYPTALGLDRIKAHYQAGIRSGVSVG